MESAVAVELMRSVPFLEQQSSDTQRILSRRFMYGTFQKGDALCYWKGGMGEVKLSEWFIVCLTGRIGVYTRRVKDKVNKFMFDGNEEGEEQEEEEEEEDNVPFTCENLSQTIMQGEGE